MASSSSLSSKRRNFFNCSQSRTVINDDHENLLHRAIPKHNLVCWLRDRELGYIKSRINHFIARRTNVYRAIHPSYSILMCTVPQAVYIRRFSPNGQYLLAFSHDLESLIVYKYKGFERIYPHLIQCSPSTNYTRLDENGDSSRQLISDAVNCEKLRDQAFNKIFEHHVTIQIRSSSIGYSLNRNHIYCLFSSDQYAIICASKLVNEQQHPPYNQLVQSNEDLNPLSRFYFEHFLIFLIDYSRGIICQQLEFQFDRIGLTIYKSTLAILSIQHQKLHLYHIDEKNGKLVELLTVGKFAQTKEEFLYKYSLPKHLLTMSPRLLNKKNFKRNSSSMFDKWEDNETGGQQRKRIRDHFSEHQNSDSSSSRLFSHNGSSFVREELHRPFTPPPTRIPLNSTEEQQTNFNSIAETNDLPANLAQSIFQRENRPIRRGFLTYPTGASSSDYDHDMSTVADDDEDDDDNDQPMNLTRIEYSTDRTINDSNDDYWSLIQNQILLPMNDKQLCTLKQRLLTYLYQRAKQSNKQLRFIHSFNDYLASKFYKVQFLTNNIILLKFAHETIVNKRQQEQQMHYALFVVYDIQTSTILNIYDDSSMELANIFEKYNDDFRYSSSYGLINYKDLEFFPLSTYAGRRQFEHMYYNSASTGDYDSIKRLLMQLPLRTITHTISPYLDLNLYSYDDKIVHIDDMIKTCPNNPVRFFSRDCQRMKFQLTLTNRSIILPQFMTTDNSTTATTTTTTTTTIITPTITNHNNNPTTTTTANAVFIPNTLSTNRRTTLTTLWHPIEPFCITIQRWPRDLDNIHNFHLYRPPNLR
ncbi:unnamed protein product [Rotaria sp. Silwood1]|nr:unnamed protein product [Rotaria sp. Silwood1]CAF0752245.1 unnamed protein product [Rotaria sp. Silwood1]CAF3358643.1 unnamed protein product [Rotaria sp. Silwood1]CAF4565121.1 unnamed protein product [Rotaria sp. Silwood1]CAF4636542.1 unnamed protein product [Rotaria sp. Silwood1]